MFFRDEDDIPEIPEDVRNPEKPSGAQDRYERRKRQFEEDGQPFPRLRHHAFWLLHNCVAHPLLALGENPSDEALELHELTSHWLNRVSRDVLGKWDRRVLHMVRPQIPDRRSWLIHNLVAHVAIGLAPCKATFDYHDGTAHKMAVPGWV